MFIRIAKDRKGLGKFAGSFAAEQLRSCLASQDRARVLVATGSSQFEVLEALCEAGGIDWARVDGFHLDEYVGLPRTHLASFCGYLEERFVNQVPIGSFHFLDGQADPARTISQVSSIWAQAPIDVALIGIGENGHLAFNDPPADFETKVVYHLVDLDLACRRQQVGEGWFANVDECPSRAISMTIHAILQSKCIVCSVPDQRKATAVAASLQGPITCNVPGSILRNHSNVTLVLDKASASMLGPEITAQAISI